jgi:integrase
MAKRVRDTGLESRAARAKLKARGKPYYKGIGQGLHLGYRKGATEGKWVARVYAGDQQYIVKTIAVADDIVDADCTHVLNFWQAQERAREVGGQTIYKGPIRVRDVMADYVAYLGDRAYDSKLRTEMHILPKLGDELVGNLTADQIRSWHSEMVRINDDPEATRKQRSSANRVLTILKAGLNRAFKEGKVDSDSEWRRVEPFKAVDASRNRYLTLAEIDRLLNACTPDFRLLVRGALETGARYGELCRLKCGDFNADSGTVHIRKSKSGKERHIILTEDGQSFFTELATGQPSDAPLFGKWWKRTEQTRWMNLASEAARIQPEVTFHGLRHTWASLAVMSGMPLMIVAKNLGHADTRMVEKHYGHLAPSYLVDQVRKFAPRFGAVSSNVKPIR